MPLRAILFDHDAIAAGDVKISGSEAKLEEMRSYLDNFDFWFNIVTP